jgi:AcrR family transcriptional regulator
MAPAHDRPPTARGRARRERLLDATAQLVAERGFHGVGISDIGAAAGVTGSAIYRHFATKTELLVAVLDRVVDGLLDRAEGIVATSDDPATTLDALIDAHVAFALRDRAILQVYAQEAHTLPPDDRRRLRRTQRRYVEHWAAVLVAACPGLDPDVARVRVQATFGLVNSVADLSTPLADDELATLLRTSARAALLAGAITPATRRAS